MEISVDFLYGIIAGVLTTFLMLFGLLFVGRVGKRLSDKWHSAVKDIIVVFLLIIYTLVVYGSVALIGMSIDSYNLYLKGWALGIFVGIILYIPFAKWWKLYK